MLDVYPAGEAPIPGADSRSLCRTIRNRGKIDPILVSDPAQVATMLAPVLTGNDLILVQGAGNVGKIARYLSEIKLKPQIRRKSNMADKIAPVGRNLCGGRFVKFRRGSVGRVT